MGRKVLDSDKAYDLIINSSFYLFGNALLTNPSKNASDNATESKNTAQLNASSSNA
jgi:hypothetical protein